MQATLDKISALEKTKEMEEQKAESHSDTNGPKKAKIKCDPPQGKERKEQNAGHSNADGHNSSKKTNIQIDPVNTKEMKKQKAGHSNSDDHSSSKKTNKQNDPANTKEKKEQKAGRSTDDHSSSKKTNIQNDPVNTKERNKQEAGVKDPLFAPDKQVSSSVTMEDLFGSDIDDVESNSSEEMMISNTLLKKAKEEIEVLKRSLVSARKKSRWADDIRTKHAFVWGDLNARNQPNAFTYGET